jgi:hypothetical protein
MAMFNAGSSNRHRTTIHYQHLPNVVRALETAVRNPVSFLATINLRFLVSISAITRVSGSKSLGANGAAPDCECDSGYSQTARMRR